MTNQAVFDHALRLLGELPASQDIADYADRAPALLCGSCGALAAADRLCRASTGQEGQVMPSGSEYALEDEFPLCDMLLPVAALHLASALVFDENPTLSDRYFQRFGQLVGEIIGALPAEIEPIKRVC